MKLLGHRLIDGLYPTTPLELAGILIDPIVSVPIARGMDPVPTQAPDPLLEPPADLEESKAD